MIDKPDFTCSVKTLHTNVGISEQQAKNIVQPYPNVFEIKGKQIKYTPPFGIFNKQSFKHAISNAFPRGIPKSQLKLCYEFAETDLHELEFTKNVYIHVYGKTEEKILFAPYTKPDTTIADLWDRVMQNYDKPSSLFPVKRKRL